MSTTKRIVIFGGTGMIGKRILDEAVSRGHQVLAVLRDTAQLPNGPSNLRAAQGNILSAHEVASVTEGSDVVISAFGPGNGNPDLIVDAAHSLIEGLQNRPQTRLIAVGGAGVLEIAPGVQLVDSPNFPPAWKGLALAHRDAYKVYTQSTGVTWTYVSPSALIEPGERTGKFRIGTKQLLSDSQGNSRISAEDFAVAILDEVKDAKYPNSAFTAGY